MFYNIPVAIFMQLKDLQASVVKNKTSIQKACICQSSLCYLDDKGESCHCFLGKYLTMTKLLLTD